MSDQEKRMVETFSRRVRELFPNALIWVFGSRARGDAEFDSDLDLCVVLDEVSPQVKSTIGHLAWEISFETQIFLNTFVISSWQFHEGPLSESTLVDNILREGIPA